MKVAMFQTFDSPLAGADTSERVARLRELMAQGRSRRACWCRDPTSTRVSMWRRRAERLAWLTGFTGSAGLAVVARNGGGAVRRRALHVQARAQVDARLFEILEIPGAKLSRLAGAQAQRRRRWSASIPGCIRPAPSKS